MWFELAGWGTSITGRREPRIALRRGAAPELVDPDVARSGPCNRRRSDRSSRSSAGRRSRAGRARLRRRPGRRCRGTACPRRRPLRRTGSRPPCSTTKRSSRRAGGAGDVDRGVEAADPLQRDPALAGPRARSAGGGRRVGVGLARRRRRRRRRARSAPGRGRRSPARARRLIPAATDPICPLCLLSLPLPISTTSPESVTSTFGVASVIFTVKVPPGRDPRSVSALALPPRPASTSRRDREVADPDGAQLPDAFDGPARLQRAEVEGLVAGAGGAAPFGRSCRRPGDSLPRAPRPAGRAAPGRAGGRGSPKGREEVSPSSPATEIVTAAVGHRPVAGVADGDPHQRGLAEVLLGREARPRRRSTSYLPSGSSESDEESAAAGRQRGRRGRASQARAIAAKAGVPRGCAVPPKAAGTYHPPRRARYDLNTRLTEGASASHKLSDAEARWTRARPPEEQ